MNKEEQEQIRKIVEKDAGFREVLEILTQAAKDKAKECEPHRECRFSEMSYQYFTQTAEGLSKLHPSRFSILK